MIITTRYPGASPEDVELMVTNKIEEELETISEIKRFISFSLENVSIVRVLLDPDEQKDYPRIKTEIPPRR